MRTPAATPTKAKAYTINLEIMPMPFAEFWLASN